MMLWMVAGLLVAGLFIVLPLYFVRREPASSATQINGANKVEANVALFAEQMALLQQQCDDGELELEQFQQLKTELEKQLLIDTPETVKSSSPARTGGGLVLLVCLLLLPVMAIGLYSFLGSGADSHIKTLIDQRNQPNLSFEQDQVIRNELLRRILIQIEGKPDHVAYLITAARLMLEEEKFLLSANYYQQVVAIMPGQPEVFAEYAQASYFASGNRITPVVESAIEQSLAIDPGNATALGLKGIGYFGAEQYSQAITVWQQALVRIPASSQQAQALMAGVEQAQIRLSSQDVDSIQNLQASDIAVSIHLSLDADLQAHPEQIIYVFAREYNGGPMPLAVSRLRVADLPATVTLNDSLAMPGGKKLSSVEEIQLVARISSSGTVNQQSGDLQGETGQLLLSEAVKGVELIIDTRL